MNGLKREWFLDLPELTSIQLGNGGFWFKHGDDSTELIMRSGYDEMNWWIDLPKLTSLTAGNSWAFICPRSITLEGISYHSILTNRHAFSFHCHSLRAMGFQMTENHPYQECLSLLSLIPRYHSRSPTVPLLSSFFHTRFTINSLYTSHSHFITLSIITPHWSTVSNRGMREDVPFHHFPHTCFISLHNSTNYITLTHYPQKRKRTTISAS